MDSQKQQAAERIKQANNILVTVSSNPSVDQLAACIGLTLALNKDGKHATAVFSGEVPSTIEFLQPEKTLEKNTDSLRDFIIALDKSKADKLRYKVEDRVVKIFITPYKTSINEKDLEFSQGDFNVDVVLALGVHNQADLDQAITSHGRILHDATVITINIKPGGELGTINWLDPAASSLSELAVQLIDLLDKKLIDGQIATGLLTGIVAETERFSNAKTSPQTMSISAELMAAGANQQLVATKLEEPAPPPPPPQPIATQEKTGGEAEGPKSEEPAKKPADDGTLEISHEGKETPEAPETPETPEPAPEEPKPEPAPEERQEPAAPQIHIDEHGSLSPAEDQLGLPPQPDLPTISRHSEAPKMVLQPPTLGGQLTANAVPGQFTEEGASGLPDLPPHEQDTLSGSPAGGESTPLTPPTGPTILPPAANEGEPQNAAGTGFLGDQPLQPPEPPKTDESATGEKTLSDLEREVHSSHVAGSQGADATATPPTPTASMLPPVSDESAPTQPPLTPPPTTDLGNVPSPSAPGAAGDSAQSNVDSARDAVTQAINASPQPTLQPIDALNAQPMHLPLGPDNQGNDVGTPVAPQGDLNNPVPPQPWTPPAEPLQQAVNPNPAPQPSFGAAPGFTPPPQPGFGQQQPDVNPPNQEDTDPNAPPPVPPPMMPPPYNS